MSRLPGFRSKQRDANEPEIVDALRKQGYYVVLLDEPFDLSVQCQFGCWHAVEIKNPDGKNTVTENQIADWQAMTRPPTVARCLSDVLNGIIQDHDGTFP